MKKLKSILSAIVVMAMFTACGNNGDDPTPGPKPNPGNKDFHGVVSQRELPIQRVIVVMYIYKHYQVSCLVLMIIAIVFLAVLVLRQL